MKICNKVPSSKKLPELIGGNLYQRKAGDFAGDIHIYCKSKHSLICLKTGQIWAIENGFGIANKPTDWEDVTDKYCLKEI